MDHTWNTKNRWAAPHDLEKGSLEWKTWNGRELPLQFFKNEMRHKYNPNCKERVASTQFDIVTTMGQQKTRGGGNRGSYTGQKTYYHLTDVINQALDGSLSWSAAKQDKNYSLLAEQRLKVVLALAALTSSEKEPTEDRSFDLSKHNEVRFLKLLPDEERNKLDVNDDKIYLELSMEELYEFIHTIWMATKKNKTKKTKKNEESVAAALKANANEDED